MNTLFLRLGIGYAFLSVCLGAFGAHAIKDTVTAERLTVYETGVLYLMIHGFALIAFGLFKQQKSGSRNWPGWCFGIGALIFSGSLILLVLLDIPKLGILTPVGGVLFLIGWFGFFQATYS